MEEKRVLCGQEIKITGGWPPEINKVGLKAGTDHNQVPVCENSKLELTHEGSAVINYS